jgi:hypothetical protein
MNAEIYPMPAVYKVSKHSLALADRRYIHLSTDHSENFIERLLEFVQASPLSIELTYGQVPTDQILIDVRLKGAKTHRAISNHY